MRLATALRYLFTGKSGDTISLKIAPSVDSDNCAYMLDYYQRLACDLIGRSFSQITFRFYEQGTEAQSANFYRWNILPNKNESGAEFKRHLAYELAMNGEALIIYNVSNEILIADSFTHTEHANIPDEFQNVLVKDFTYTGTYRHGINCVYIRVRNAEQDIIRDTVMSTYGKIMAHTVSSYLDSYARRMKVKINATATSDDDRKKALQETIDRQAKAFYSSTKSVIAETNGIEYSEFGQNGATVTEDKLVTLSDAALKSVSSAYGIPTVMMTGTSTANIDSSEIMDEYVNACLAGYAEMISGAITTAIYCGGSRMPVGSYCSINPNEARTYDVISNADKLDKAAASGLFTINEVRAMFGYSALPNGGDKIIMTKNYSKEGDQLQDEKK